VKGKTPNKKEKKWFNFICDYGCIVCHNEKKIYSPCEPHHLIDGMGSKKEHLRTIGLCPPHHRFGRNDAECVSFHPYKREWERRYGKQDVLLKQLQSIYREECI
jgi:hypothetical protein